MPKLPKITDYCAKKISFDGTPIHEHIYSVTAFGKKELEQYGYVLIPVADCPDPQKKHKFITT